MQLKSKVVIRYVDGRMIKGYTLDFMPNKDTFHITHLDDEKRVTDVALSDLKAVFYVKDFEGVKNRPSPDHSLESIKRMPGLKLRVTFVDGEVLWGSTNGYNPGRKGFFLLPVDKGGNNERVFVVAGATKSVEIMK